MPSVKPVIKANRVNADGKTPVLIRISHNRKVRYIPTSYYIDPQYMDNNGNINSKHPSANALNKYLAGILKDIYDSMAAVGGKINSMEINALVDIIKYADGSGVDFVKYTRDRIRILEMSEKTSMVNSLTITLQHLEKYNGSKVLTFNRINKQFLAGFESYLRIEKLKINTIAVYMRNIRLIFNQAIDADLVRQDVYPFRKYKIRHETTPKRAVGVDTLRKLIKADLKVNERQAVDLFLLSFYLVGINFKDMLMLKATDLVDGRVSYRRAKTGRLYSVKVEPEALSIIDKYRGNKFLLNLIEVKRKVQEKKDRSTPLYKDITDYTNRLLRRLGKNLELGPISTYTARHSWATIAASLGVPRDVISHALGHGINTVTDIYIDFSRDDVDKANRRVINSL